jgi:hypothetical protein
VNPFFREHLRSTILGEAAKIRALDRLNHQYVRGRLREIFVRNILAPLSPPQIGFTSGKIVDWRGQESKLLDVIVYRRDLFQILAIDLEISLVPIECVIYSIEVKTTVNRTELRKSIDVFRSLRRLEALHRNGSRTERKPFSIRCVVFGFADVFKDGHSILNYYEKLDNERPPAMTIYLTQKAYLFYGNPPGTNKIGWCLGVDRTSFEDLTLDFFEEFRGHHTQSVSIPPTRIPEGVGTRDQSPQLNYCVLITQGINLTVRRA